MTVASAEGVQVTVNSQRWKGQPGDLDSIVTPLHVVVENGSQVPIRIRYRDFTLTNSQGLQSAAIPPFAIQRPGSRVAAVAPAVMVAVRPMRSIWPLNSQDDSISTGTHCLLKHCTATPPILPLSPMIIVTMSYMRD